jgi:hypothetical protein
MGELLKQLLLNLVTNPTVVITAVLAVLGMLLKKGLRQRRVFWAGHNAYMAVESLKAQLREEGKDTGTLDKVSEALRIADEYMIQNNWGQLSEAEHQALKLQFQSIHGAVKLAAQQTTASKGPAIALPH